METHNFQTASIHEGRLVWNPIVHQRLYDENCYYFLVRMRSPEPDLVQRFKGILSKAGIRSYCVYVLYGYYDLLIRVWATTQKRRGLMEQFRAVSSLTEAVREFQASAIRYLWAKNSPDSENLLSFKASIEAVCKKIALNEPPDKNMLAKLESAGILHELEARPPTSIKFYIVLSRSVSNPHVPAEEDLILEAIKGAGSSIHDISIYSGIGFANYLVKAVAKDYGSISDSTNKIFSALRGLDIRPMTLLIADDRAPEADHIDIEWEDFSRDMLQLAQLLGPKADALIARMPVEQRDVVGKLFKENSVLLGTPFGSVLEGLLLSRIQEDKAILVEKFSFVLRLELLLRKFFIELFSTKFGVDWFQEVQTAAAQAAIDQKKNPARDYTLHDYLTVADKLIAIKKISVDDVDSVLDHGWKEKLEKLKDLRNAFAHGKMFADDFNLTVEWEHVAKISCQVGNIYNSLLTRYASV